MALGFTAGNWNFDLLLKQGPHPSRSTCTLCSLARRESPCTKNKGEGLPVRHQQVDATVRGRADELGICPGLNRSVAPDTLLKRKQPQVERSSQGPGTMAREPVSNQCFEGPDVSL